MFVCLCRHFQETQHTYSMELGNNKVWDYIGDNYVHRLVQNKSDGKLVQVDEGGNPVQEEKVDALNLEVSDIQDHLLICVFGLKLSFMTQVWEMSNGIAMFFYHWRLCISLAKVGNVSQNGFDHFTFVPSRNQRKLLLLTMNDNVKRQIGNKQNQPHIVPKVADIVRKKTTFMGGIP